MRERPITPSPDKVVIKIAGNMDDYTQSFNIAKSSLQAFGASATQILTSARAQLATIRQEVGRGLSMATAAISGIVNTFNAVIGTMGMQLDPINAAILDSVGVAAQVGLQIAAILMAGGPESPTFYQGLLVVGVTASAGMIGVMAAYQGRLRAQLAIQQAQLMGLRAGNYVETYLQMVKGM